MLRGMVKSIPDCAECGLPHVTTSFNQACTAHRRNTEEPIGCRQEPIKGGYVCHYHGGALPAVRRKAQERLELRNATKLLHSFGKPVVVDPAAELLDLIAHTAGYVRFIRTRVDALHVSDMNFGMSKLQLGGKDSGETYEAKPNVWVAMLDHWSERHAKLLVEALKLNLDERRVKVAEEQGDALVRVLDGVLEDLGHDPEDVKVAAIVARRLRLVA